MKNMKMKYVDAIVAVVFLICLVALYFVWGCRMDLYVTILAGAVILVTGTVRTVQYKKLKELMPEEANRS